MITMGEKFRGSVKTSDISDLTSIFVYFGHNIKLKPKPGLGGTALVDRM